MSYPMSVHGFFEQRRDIGAMPLPICGSMTSETDGATMPGACLV